MTKQVTANLDLTIVLLPKDISHGRDGRSPLVITMQATTGLLAWLPTTNVGQGLTQLPIVVFD